MDQLIQFRSSSVSTTPSSLLLNAAFTAPALRPPPLSLPDKSLIKVSRITSCAARSRAQKQRISKMIISKTYCDEANTAANSERIRDLTAQLLSGFCNAVEWLIDIGCQSAANRHDVDERDDILRQGNFAPVQSEWAPDACQLERGRLPSFLEGGIYVRNGPNKRYPVAGAAQHFFDGDGMLHAVTFRDAGEAGPATYCCRYTRTSRFLQEDPAGRALFPKVFGTSRAAGFLGFARIGLALLRHVSGLLDLSQGIGLANSGVAFHHGKLLALSEDDLPHEMRVQADGDLATVGRYTLKRHGTSESALLPSLWAMTSHPTIDPRTGEMLAFGYNPLFNPHLTYFRVSQEGVLSEGVHVPVREPSMMHAFAVTEHFVVFPDVQVVFRPLRILSGQSPIVCDARKTPRFGVLPRGATDGSGIRWFDVPGCNCFHFLNAWEEEDIAGGGTELVLIVPAIARVDHVLLGDLQNFHATLTEVRLNISTGQIVSQRPIFSSDPDDRLNLEMGNINRNFLGRPNRFLYMGVAGRFPNLAGIVKVDVRSRKVLAKRSFTSADGSYASEPFFVPATSSTSESDEDHGCVLCLVHHEPTHTSRLLVLDPLHLHTLASIKLPRRVPYGFHGLFISKEELAHNS